MHQKVSTSAKLVVAIGIQASCRKNRATASTAYGMVDAVPATEATPAHAVKRVSHYFS